MQLFGTSIGYLITLIAGRATGPSLGAFTLQFTSRISTYIKKCHLYIDDKQICYSFTVQKIPKASER